MGFYLTLLVLQAYLERLIGVHTYTRNILLGEKAKDEHLV